LQELMFRLFIKDYKQTQKPEVRLLYGTVSGITGLVCNALLFAVKLFIGVISGSISITADALNNLSDAGSSVISLIGFKLAGKPADKEHPFGHGRMEYIAGLIISFFMLIVGFELGRSSIEKIISPTEVSYNALTIIILIISMLIKLWMSFFYRGAGKKINSETLIAAAKDSVNDVLTTGAILVSVIVMYVFKVNIDAYMGMAVAVYIIISGVMALKQTTDPLLGQPPSREMIDSIVNTLLSHEEIAGVHDIIVHNYGPGRCIATVHAEVPVDADILKVHDVVDFAEHEVLEKYNILLTVHVDPIETNNEKVLVLRELATQIALSINENITIHDFRIAGEANTNMIFDLVNPSDSKISDSEIKRIFQEKLKNINEKYSAVITVDKDFI